MRFLATALLLAASPFAAFAEFDATADSLRQGSNVLVSVVYSSVPDVTEAENIFNFTVNPSDAVIESVRYLPNSRVSLLTVSGLNPNASNFEISLLGVPSLDHSESVHRSFRVFAPEASLAVIGASELGFESDGVALGQGSYELVSGAFEFSGVYDEATFVYQTAQGDFDKVARVESQDNGSPYARAGLMVREAADAGRPRPLDEADPEQAFSRYLNVYVSPVAGVDGTPGNPYFTSDTRLFTGGIGRPDGGAVNTVVFDTTPARTYPEAWVRIKRLGDVFQTFSSADGTNWVSLAETTFPTADLNGAPIPAFSTNALIGLFYSADNGNIPFGGGDRGSYKARFTDFSGFVKEGQPPRPAVLSARRAGQEIVVSWTNGGTLWTAPSAAGPWTELVGKPSPQRFDLVQAGRFFQVRNP